MCLAVCLAAANRVSDPGAELKGARTQQEWSSRKWYAPPPLPPAVQYLRRIRVSDEGPFLSGICVYRTHTSGKAPNSGRVPGGVTKLTMR